MTDQNDKSDDSHQNQQKQDQKLDKSHLSQDMSMNSQKQNPAHKLKEEMAERLKNQQPVHEEQDVYAPIVEKEKSQQNQSFSKVAKAEVQKSKSPTISKQNIGESQVPRTRSVAEVPKKEQVVQGQYQSQVKVYQKNKPYVADPEVQKRFEAIKEQKKQQDQQLQSRQIQLEQQYQQMMEQEEQEELQERLIKEKEHQQKIAQLHDYQQGIKNRRIYLEEKTVNVVMNKEIMHKPDPPKDNTKQQPRYQQMKNEHPGLYKFIPKQKIAQPLPPVGQKVVNEDVQQNEQQYQQNEQWAEGVENVGQQ